MIFTPNIKVVGNIRSVESIDTIENEIMLHGASVDFAKKIGGPITQSIISKIEHGLDLSLKHYVIDTKSVMLMPGMIPSIPGWHCDGVTRAFKGDQPDINKLNPNVVHYCCLVSSHPEGVSNTEYVTEELNIETDPKRVWGSLNSAVERLDPKTMKAVQGEIIKFTQSTIHRASPAFNNGWRYFFRLSEYHMPPINKIRHQVQVYADPSIGW